MSTTRWERLRALSDRLRGAWDAHRDGRDWEAVYLDAREAVATRMEADAAMVRGLRWDEFKRLQHIGPQPDADCLLPAEKTTEQAA